MLIVKLISDLLHGQREPYNEVEPQYLLECTVEFGVEVSEFKCNTVN